MSKFFRSPNSSESSLSESSSGEDAEGTQASGKQLTRLDTSSTLRGEVSQGSEVSLESLTLDRRSSGSGPSLHRDFLLHALLEERCMKEVLHERGGNSIRRTSQDEREIQIEAHARYQRLCAQLAPLNLVSTGLDHERHRPARQKYRDGLDILNKGNIAPSTRRNGMPAPIRRLLTDQGESGPGPPFIARGFSEPVSPASVLDVFTPSHQLLVASQYLRDFEELGVLGKGGYGTVFHVKHRLDGLAYAVKKVPIRPSIVARIQSPGGQAAVDEILTELRTLAKLDHPNVVRYFNSWIEWSTNASPESFSDDMLSNGRSLGGEAVLRTEHGHLSVSNSLQRVFTESDHQDDIGIAFESHSLKPTRSGSITQFATGISDAFSNSTSESALWSTSEPTLALHMQMAIYPMTLHDFLSPKLTSGVTPLAHCFHLEPSIEILLAIIDGVEYLHSEGIIHRDIKPANIFLRLENNPRRGRGCVDLFLCSACRANKQASPATLSVRIGDFGLVTSIAQSEETDPSSQPVVGTEIYRPAASKSHISPKLDVFALGIVAFELVWKFGTQMERRETLQGLKKGEFPAQFSHLAGGRGEKLKHCIAAMLSDDPWNATGSFDDLREGLSAVLQSNSGQVSS